MKSSKVFFNFVLLCPYEQRKTSFARVSRRDKQQSASLLSSHRLEPRKMAEFPPRPDGQLVFLGENTTKLCWSRQPPPNRSISWIQKKSESAAVLEMQAFFYEISSCFKRWNFIPGPRRAPVTAFLRAGFNSKHVKMVQKWRVADALHAYLPITLCMLYVRNMF